MEVFEGQPDGRGRRIAVCVSRFNDEVTGRLLRGAVAALLEAGVRDEDVTVAQVPGAFELPWTARTLIARGRAQNRPYDAVVVLGAVIRGETDHYDYVCDAAERGTLDVSLSTGVPVLFGVLTCDTDEQALGRASGAHGNKGADVARDALRMAQLAARLGGAGDRR